jgi:tRNA A37 threonylcarbamoyladenosine modification protein TsaB
LQIPIRKLSILTLLYYTISDADVIIPVIDARKNRLYCSMYAKNGKKILEHADLGFEQVKTKVNQINNEFKKNGETKRFVFVTNEEDLKIDLSGLGDNVGFVLTNENLASVLIKHKDRATILESFQGPDYVRSSDAQVCLQK